jgi:hypothetical protein
MNINYRQIDEVNMLFENIKTILITWLPQARVKKLLKKYTHNEIRCWERINNKFVITDLVMHDNDYLKHKEQEIYSLLVK